MKCVVNASLQGLLKVGASIEYLAEVQLYWTLLDFVEVFCGTSWFSLLQKLASTHLLESNIEVSFCGGIVVTECFIEQ